jgi:hypothetical protein
MIGVIPNPTKKVTIDFPLDQVKEGVKRIPSLLKKYKMFKTNEAFNVYTLEASEFLSVGVYIDINLTPVADTRTEFNVEVKRKLGSFDHWVEVQNANEHIDKLITGLSKTMTSSSAELENLEAVETQNEAKTKSSRWPVIIGILIGLWILGKMFG